MTVALLTAAEADSAVRAGAPVGGVGALDGTSGRRDRCTIGCGAAGFTAAVTRGGAGQATGRATGAGLAAGRTTGCAAGGATGAGFDTGGAMGAVTGGAVVGRGGAGTGATGAMGLPAVVPSGAETGAV